MVDGGECKRAINSCSCGAAGRQLDKWKYVSIVISNHSLQWMPYFASILESTLREFYGPCVKKMASNMHKLEKSPRHGHKLWYCAVRRPTGSQSRSIEYACRFIRLHGYAWWTIMRVSTHLHIFHRNCNYCCEALLLRRAIGHNKFSNPYSNLFDFDIVESPAPPLHRALDAHCTMQATPERFPAGRMEIVPIAPEKKKHRKLCYNVIVAAAK